MDPYRTLTCTNSPGWGYFSTDALIEDMAKIRLMLDRLPKPDFDCVICKPDTAAKIKEALGERRSYPLTFDMLRGLPLYIRPDDESCVLLAADLRGRGHNPQIVK